MTSASMLTGKVAIVTGAGRGIGREAALAMAASGASVIVNDLDEAAASSVSQEIVSGGGEAVPLIAAIGSKESAENCVAAAIKAFGRLDIMCTNAGIIRDRVLWKTEDPDFDAVIETHLRGTFTCARAAALHFRATGQGGRLILMTSISALKGNVGQTAYSAAKAGIAAMARTWSLELMKSDITVNAIVPNALTRMAATMPSLAGYVADVEAGRPLPSELRSDLGIGTPKDVAPLFVFLSSDAARDVTGQCIGIGGDRLSLWSNPEECAVARKAGGWTPEAIAEQWKEKFSSHAQRAGVEIKFPSS